MTIENKGGGGGEKGEGEKGGEGGGEGEKGGRRGG